MHSYCYAYVARRAGNAWRKRIAPHINNERGYVAVEKYIRMYTMEDYYGYVIEIRVLKDGTAYFDINGKLHEFSTEREAHLWAWRHGFRE